MTASLLNKPFVFVRFFSTESEVHVSSRDVETSGNEKVKQYHRVDAAANRNEDRLRLRTEIILFDKFSKQG